MLKRIKTTSTSSTWQQCNKTLPLLFSRNSPKFTRSTLISSTATRFLRSAHIFSRSTKQIHGQGGDYFFPWEREHTRRVATSYLLFLHILFLWAGFPCLLFLVPVAVLSLLRYLLRAIERSRERPLILTHAQHQLDQRGVIPYIILQKEPSIRVALFIFSPSFVHYSQILFGYSFYKFLSL